MIALFVRLLLLLLPLLGDGADWIFALPGDEIVVDFDTDWFERYAFVLYPVLALGTIGLVVIAIVSTLRSDEITGIAKVEYKRDIITMLRREVGGLPLEKIAKSLKQSNSRTAHLLAGMQEDGLVLEQSIRKRKIWRLRGVGSD